MKKTYSKPAIVFESFALSTSIAAGCEGLVDNPSKGYCGISNGIPGNNLFSQFITGDLGCQVWEDDDEHNSYCYHVPTEANTFFNSL